MKNKVSEADMKRLIDASTGSKFRLQITRCVAERFKSAHYLSSRLIIDCVILNLVLNDKISPDSADEIITTVRRNNKSFYTTVESAFFPIENEFNDYAKDVLGDEFVKIKASMPRPTNFIVDVISLDMSRKNINKKEFILQTYSYRELVENKVPHY